MVRVGLAAGTVVLFMHRLALPVLAHALLLWADPAPDAVLPSAPPAVQLWFSEDINPSASSIVVWDRFRHDQSIGATQLATGSSRQLRVRLRRVPAGTYLVLWTSVSADDGHLVRGSYLFSVKRRGPIPPHPGVTLGNGDELPPGPVGLASLLARWLELIAVTVWAGTVAISAFVFSPLAERIGLPRSRREYAAVRRVVWIAVPFLMAVGVASLALQAYTFAYGDWSSAFSRPALLALLASQYGQTWVGREGVLVLALLLALAVMGGFTPSSDRLEFTGTQTLISVSYLWMLAAGGHAASANIGALPGHEGHLFSVAIGIDVLHLAADALWLGGQFYIAVIAIPIVLGSEEAHEHLDPFLQVLNRFSPFAYVSVALFSLSGLFSGVVHIPALPELVDTIYGRALIVKMTLIAAMLLISTLTAYGLRPALQRKLRAEHGAAIHQPAHLLFWLRVNPLLGAGVLFATSVMFFFPVQPAVIAVLSS